MSKSDNIEDSLVQEAQKGDRSAQKALFEILAPTMMGVCMRYGNNREEAEDLLHDGFIRLFERLDKYSFQSPIEAWSRRVFVNMCINHVTRGKRKHFYEEIEEDKLAQTETNDSAYADLLDKMEMKEILQCIHDLPEKYRLVLNLYAIDGLSHQQIADQCKISVGASKSRLSRARVLLNKLIEKRIKRSE